MATLKKRYRKWGGTEWNVYHFETSADMIAETASLKVMTDAERTSISNYLSVFNAANKLVQLDSSALIPVGLIPSLAATYLTKAAPSFTGHMTGATGSTITADGGFKVDGTSGLFKDTYGFKFNANGVETFKASNNGGVKTIDMNAFRLIGLAEPSSNSDAATKSYVDTVAATGAHPVTGGPVDVATTSNYAAFPTAGPITIDGVQFLTSDVTFIRVLVRAQSTAAQNGIYLVERGVGNVLTWTKITADSTVGALVFVEQGNTYNDWNFYNTDGQVWTAWTKVDTILADGLTLQKTGTTLAVKAGGISNSHVAAAAAIAWSKLASEAASDATAYASMIAPGTAASLTTRINDIMSALKLARGTANYHTSNSQSIMDAYAKLAELLPDSTGAVGYLLSTANLTSLSGSQTVDGVASGTDGKIVILVGQSSASQNGVYRTAAGVWTQISVFEKNAYYTATNGSSNANKVYRGIDATTATLIYNGSANIPVGMTILDFN